MYPVQLRIYADRETSDSFGTVGTVYNRQAGTTELASAMSLMKVVTEAACSSNNRFRGYGYLVNFRLAPEKYTMLKLDYPAVVKCSISDDVGDGNGAILHRDILVWKGSKSDEAQSM